MADGAPIGHSGRALIKRDPTDGHIRIDGLTELLSEGGDLLLTDANGATSGWLVCWQQLKRAQQLLVHKQLYARMRKEANLLGRSTPFADNGGEDDSASDPSAAAATVAVSGSGSGGLPITATVLDNGLVVEHAPFPPITFTFPRGGVDGFVVSGDGLSSALQSVLCWNAALRIFLRRRHAPRAPTASERTVLGKAAARQQAMATANAAAASGSTSGSAAAAVAAVAALRDSSADGSTAGSGSGNSVWLIPRLVRALNFHRLQARIRRILGSYTAPLALVVALELVLIVLGSCYVCNGYIMQMNWCWSRQPPNRRFISLSKRSARYQSNQQSRFHDRTMCTQRYPLSRQVITFLGALCSKRRSLALSSL